MTHPRVESASATYTRLGFADPARARLLAEDKSLAGLIDPMDESFSDGVIEALGVVADPDLALLTLVRLMESLRAKVAAHPDDDDLDQEVPALIAALRTPGVARARLLAVLGASIALGDHLVAHPEHWRSVAEVGPMVPKDRIAGLVDAVRNPGKLTPDDALRVAYRRGLLGIAALDLVAPDPLADLAEAALEAAMVIARDDAGDAAAQCRFAVIAMGKTGGRELNFISDVDVIFVAEPAEGVAEDVALKVATGLATRLMAACGASTAHGSLWQVDAALRPEGKQGPLVRTVSSHRAYYERWAKTWEFQALLKARVVAGDRDLGATYLEAVQPMVWQAASRENFVDDVQAVCATSSSASNSSNSFTAAPTRRCGRAPPSTGSQPSPREDTSGARTRQCSPRHTGCCAPLSTACNSCASVAPTSCRPASPSCADSAGRLAIAKTRQPPSFRPGRRRPTNCGDSSRWPN